VCKTSGNIATIAGTRLVQWSAVTIEAGSLAVAEVVVEVADASPREDAVRCDRIMAVATAAIAFSDPIRVAGRDPGGYHARLCVILALQDGKLILLPN